MKAQPKMSPKYAGRLGGLKGGKARAVSLSPERRSEIARKAAKKRWLKNLSKKAE
jgi:general stress protein YciG